MDNYYLNNAVYLVEEFLKSDEGSGLRRRGGLRRSRRALLERRPDARQRLFTPALSPDVHPEVRRARAQDGAARRGSSVVEILSARSPASRSRADCRGSAARRRAGGGADPAEHRHHLRRRPRLRRRVVVRRRRRSRRRTSIARRGRACASPTRTPPPRPARHRAMRCSPASTPFASLARASCPATRPGDRPERRRHCPRC